MRPASVHPPLVHELARSLRSLRQCYAGTANRRLGEALVRDARDIVRRVCGFDVELPSTAAHTSLDCSDPLRFPRAVSPPAFRRSPLVVLFLTVFIDLMGFGIVIPLLPAYA